MAEFLHMGGYAAYVWTSFGLTFIVLGGIVTGSMIELRRVRAETFRRARTPRRSGR